MFLGHGELVVERLEGVKSTGAEVTPPVFTFGCQTYGSSGSLRTQRYSDCIRSSNSRSLELHLGLLPLPLQTGPAQPLLPLAAVQVRLSTGWGKTLRLRGVF